jgi:predicted enzyme involved in methoxymalonyl-ACP biosynthesis
MIGVAIVERDPSAWRLRLFTVSCRAAGRDAPVAFLGSLVARARAAGSRALRVDLRASEANLEVRVLLRACGFEAVGEPSDGAVVLSRDTATDLPAVPWLSVGSGVVRG